MATDASPLPPERAAVTADAVGLVANGNCGSWGVDVDETLGGAEHWYLQIEGPPFYLYFPISGPAVVESILSFLDRNEAASPDNGGKTQDAELEIGSFDGAPVSFLWDSEETRRLIVLVPGTGGASARLPISGSDLDDLIEALRQVRGDLAEEGLLANAS